MRIHSEAERRIAEATLKEVMQKLEEAFKLARLQEQAEAEREHACAGTHG